MTRHVNEKQHKRINKSEGWGGEGDLWSEGQMERDEGMTEKRNNAESVSDGRSGVVKVLQQCASLLFSDVHLIFQILQKNIKSSFNSTQNTQQQQKATQTIHATLDRFSKHRCVKTGHLMIYCILHFKHRSITFSE